MDANTLAKSIVDQATGEKPKKKRKSEQAVSRGKARWAGIDPKVASKQQQDNADKRWHSVENSVKIETEE